jgi:hypothetical protein
MTQPDQATPASAEKERAFLAAYSEICKSYHAIDDFRMKLLGLLPLASIVSVAFLDTSKLLSATPHQRGSELISFAALFAAMLTLALFGYEVRGIQRCHNLIIEGKHLEQLLGVGHGQFHVCEEEHASSPLRALNAKLIACIIYSLVFSGWLFIALRFGIGWEAGTCVACASLAGLAFASLMYSLVRRLTPS